MLASLNHPHIAAIYDLQKLGDSYSEGKHEDARKAMDEETRKFADAIFWGTTPMAEFYAMLGENSEALDWLRKAVRNGDERISYFRRNPRFASLRNDPRFQSIISNVEARRGSRQ